MNLNENRQRMTKLGTMLQPIMHVLAKKKIILASGSPRRKTILSNIGLLFEVMPSTFEETLNKDSFEKPEEYAIETAKQKALEVASRLSKQEVYPDLIIGADTVIAMDGDIYEKPKSKEHAFQMLSGFSGNSHTVYTGVVLITPKIDQHSGDIKTDRFQIESFSEATEVKFASVDPEIISAYIETGEPMDKAGGYGIQATGGTLVESITGDYFNVMGFPLHSFAKRLLAMFRCSGVS